MGCQKAVNPSHFTNIRLFPCCAFPDVKKEKDGEEQQPCFLSFCVYLYTLVLCPWVHCSKRRKTTSRIFSCCCFHYFHWHGITAKVFQDSTWHIETGWFSVLKRRWCLFLLWAFSFDLLFFHQIFFSFSCYSQRVIILFHLILLQRNSKH